AQPRSRRVIGAELGKALDLRPRRSWRSTKNTLMTAVLGAAVVAVAGPLVLVMGSVFAKGGAIPFQGFPPLPTHALPPTRATPPRPARPAPAWGPPSSARCSSRASPR